MAKYFTARDDEQKAVRQFRAFCLHDNLHFLIKKQMVSILKAINEMPQRALKGEFKVSKTQIDALERRGFIIVKHKGWVCTELGLHALAFAEAAGIMPREGEPVIAKAQVVAIGKKKAKAA